MTAYVDSHMPEEMRRQRLYGGDIFLVSPTKSSIELVRFARELIEKAFGDLDPRTAQYSMSVEQYVSIIAPLKPHFIHHPESKRLIRGILEDMACDLDLTYQDVPRLRMVTSDGYLTSGVGYAHHPHRDTWYSAPPAQVNWWLPIYPMEAENSMAFHPGYWDKPIKNTSRRFDYYRWNAEGRANAATYIDSDPRDQPKPEETIQTEPACRFVTEPGGMILFSAAHLHSTVPNTSGKTRYSIDFRTVDINDVKAVRGASNIDWECTGTSLRDFRRSVDLQQTPEEVAVLYDTRGPTDGVAVYQPEAVTR
jgi:hypothetical protein